MKINICLSAPVKTLQFYRCLTKKIIMKEKDSQLLFRDVILNISLNQKISGNAETFNICKLFTTLERSFSLLMYCTYVLVLMKLKMFSYLKIFVKCLNLIKAFLWQKMKKFCYLWTRERYTKLCVMLTKFCELRIIFWKWENFIL